MEVIAVYNWKGVLSGYQFDNSFVPIAEGNRHYQMIISALEAGHCYIREPEFLSVTKTYTENGILSGYHWSGMYIPLDPANYLYNKIIESIDSHTCEVKEPKEKMCNEKISSLIINIIFNEPWPHIIDVYEGSIKYRSNSSAKSRDYIFRLVNLPLENRSNALDLLHLYHGITSIISMPSFDISCGVLEIEIPASLLLSLFKNEKQYLTSEDDLFILDLLEQHLLMTGRGRKGPDISWLTSFSKYYLRNFITQIGNNIINAFSLEYGGLPIYFIDKWVVYERTFIVKKFENGNKSWAAFSSQVSQNFNLSGKWDKTVGILSYEEPENYMPTQEELSIKKANNLLKLGYHLEALILINTFLEVSITKLLMYFVRSNPELVQIIYELGHRRRLDIFLDISIFVKVRDSIIGKDFFESLSKAKKIYIIRNRYIHELILPNRESFISSNHAKGIEEMLNNFTDSWNLRTWYSDIAYISSNYSNEIRDIINKSIIGISRADKFT